MWNSTIGWIKSIISLERQNSHTPLCKFENAIALMRTGWCQPVCPSICRGGRPTEEMCRYDALPSCTSMPTLITHFGAHGRHDLSCDPRQFSLATQNCLCVKGKPELLEFQADLELPLDVKHNRYFFLCGVGQFASSTVRERLHTKKN